MTNTATPNPDYSTEPAPVRTVVSVGLDGASRPMWRYLADMHLADHQRRIVAPEHRPIR